MNPVLLGAIVGGIIGLVTVIITFYRKDQRYKKLLKSVQPPIDYSGLYHYASFKRFRKSAKFFDSYGILYLSGHMLYYKTNEGVPPMVFDLRECSVQMEPEWRWLKWFSVTTPAGEKFYFDSQKMGVFKNNSDETLKGYQAIKAKTSGA